MKLLPILLILALILLPSCMNGNRAGITNPVTRAEKVDTIDNSANLQANAQAAVLGVQISKLESELTGVKSNISDLVRINNDLELKIGKMENNLSLSNELRLQLKNQMDLALQIQTSANISALNGMKNELAAQLQVIAELKLKLDATVNAQVGMNNKVDELKQTSGRDSININQFNRETLEAIKSGNQTTIYSALIFCLVIGLILFFYNRNQVKALEKKLIKPIGEK